MAHVLGGAGGGSDGPLHGAGTEPGDGGEAGLNAADGIMDAVLSDGDSGGAWASFKSWLKRWLPL
jgi:hypothetical protein